VTFKPTGGGSSAPVVGAQVTHGPFGPFNFNTPNLNTGISFFIGTLSDILIDVWMEVLTAFNGTTPKADCGFISGLFSNANYLRPLDVTGADVATVPGVQWGVRTTFKNTGLRSQSMFQLRDAPSRFTGAIGLQVWVSQTGTSGGAAVGGTTGSLQVFIATSTPSPT
jgi:hypothetical protein